MQSRYSDGKYLQVLATLESMENALDYIVQWHAEAQITSGNDYLMTPGGMQLLAASAMHLTAIGEGINRISKIDSGFLADNYPEIPWRQIVGLRNQIAHGYFEIDADIVYDVINREIDSLKHTIRRAIIFLEDELKERGTAED